jgi:hypothetical protein
MLEQKLELEAGESITKIVSRHWFVIVSKLIGTVLVAIVPIVFLTVVFNLPVFNVINIQFGKYPAHIAFFIALWLLLSTMSGFVVWTMYNLDVWVITNRRLITVKQEGFFSRNVGAFRLERLQDVQYHVSGILPTFLDYGTVSAQTAGESEAEFRSEGLPDPEGIQSLLQHAVDERLHEVDIEPFRRATAEPQSAPSTPA